VKVFVEDLELSEVITEQHQAAADGEYSKVTAAVVFEEANGGIGREDDATDRWNLH
jgi:hypothetical protein